MLAQYQKEVKMTTDLLHRVDIMCEYRRDFLHGLCNVLNINNFLPAATWKRFKKSSEMLGMCGCAAV